MISSGNDEPRKGMVMYAMIRDPQTTTSELTDFMVWAINIDDNRPVLDILRVSCM
jgi:hypothetical protein